jgi:hypothetical protein
MLSFDVEDKSLFDFYCSCDTYVFQPIAQLDCVIIEMQFLLARILMIGLSGAYLPVLSVSSLTNELETSSLDNRPQLVRDALARNKPIYYFGLGSNMSRKKLENRGLNGTKIDILRMEPAFVPEYRLAFNMRGFPPIEPGMGSLEPVTATSQPLLAYEKAECHGALVRLTPENYEKVMRSEGVGNNMTKPERQGYEEIVVQAYPYGQCRKPVQAVALRARAHVRLTRDPCPSVRYMTILREGAKELGLKPCYQKFLAEHPVQELKKWQTKQALYNMLVTWTLSKTLNWSGLSQLQSKLLFLVYARPSSNPLVRFLSDLLTALILLPGSIIGFLSYHTLRACGKTPPFMVRMMALFGNDDEDKSDT